MKRKQQIAGLYLWLVTVRYYHRDPLHVPAPRQSVRLWITTPTENIDRAVAKALNVFKRDYEGKTPKVTDIESHGTVDA
jgi:hypothetical protein